MGFEFQKEEDQQLFVELFLGNKNEKEIIQKNKLSEFIDGINEDGQTIYFINVMINKLDQSVF